MNLLDRSLSVQPHGRPTAAEFALDLRHCCRPIPVELFAGVSRPASPVVAPVAAGRHRVGAHRATRNGAARDAPGRSERAERRARTSGTRVRPWVRPAGVRPVRHRRRPSVGPGGDDRSSEQFTHGVRLALATRPASRAERLRGSLRRPPPAAGWLRPSSGCWASPARCSGTSTGPRDRVATTGRDARRGDPPGREPGCAGPGGPARWTDGANRPSPRTTRTLLARVYQSPSLQSQDAALLARLTPPGCGLIGVRTSFSDVHAAREPTGRCA